MMRRDKTFPLIDLSFFLIETKANPTHVAALMLFELPASSCSMTSDRDTRSCATTGTLTTRYKVCRLRRFLSVLLLLSQIALGGRVKTHVRPVSGSARNKPAADRCARLISRRPIQRSDSECY